ncbi:bone morphogenetic protein 10-like [Ciona intestinalis]
MNILMLFVLYEVGTKVDSRRHNRSKRSGDMYDVTIEEVETNVNVTANALLRNNPQFMLDLFERFENDPMTRPSSNIIRSFFNQASSRDQQTYESRFNACNGGVCPRKHLLVFDITSLPRHEHVTMAELRLYKVVERDRIRFVGQDRIVEVVEIEELDSPNYRRLLDSKRIIGRSSGWETFYITEAVRRWVKKNVTSHQLEVSIETISDPLDEDMVDIEQHAMVNKEPSLVIFSDDTSHHHRLERLEEAQELINNKVLPMRTKRNVRHKVEKRSAREPCHYENMYVNFADIGYDWVISPQGYSAGRCVGTCEIPYTGTDVTNHAIIQSWMHARSPTNKKPCCVPIKLGTLSMLYMERASLAYRYKYRDMRVLRCGCR